MFGVALIACASGPNPSPGAPSEAALASATPRAAATASAEATADPTLVPTVVPTAQPTVARTPRPTVAPTPRPTPAPAASGWDPTHVTVKFGTVATVPGRPLAIANAADGSGRLFVAEQGGAVYVLTGGTVTSTPFLDISDQVSNGGEQGLLGLAFHPGFPTDNRVFVDYTNVAGDTVVSSFAVDPGSPDVVVPRSEVVVLTVEQPYANHNGGGIGFGPDGYLYIALGDGGSGGDPHNNGQRLDTLLGKILRIDVDHPSAGLEYGIPGSNPFAGTAGTRGEIWLLGLRNPFRFSFDRTTGDLWIGDVGQGDWEEIDVARKGVGGLNFGWRVMEGAHCFSPSSGCSKTGLTLPVVEYAHDFGCAVIGGVVYRGSASPLLKGGYVFSDECTGLVWAVNAAATGRQALVQVADVPDGIAGYGEDASGELYAADLSGTIYRISAVAR